MKTKNLIVLICSMNEFKIVLDTIKDLLGLYLLQKFQERCFDK